MAAPIEPPSGAARLAYFTPVREYPPLADRKASILLAAYGLMVTVLFVFAGPTRAILIGSRQWAAHLMAMVLLPLSTLILCGAWYAFRALTRPIPPMPDSLAFYPHIAALSPELYRRRVKDLDQNQAVTAMLHYNYSLATLSVEKFRLVERSITCARATFELWMLLLLLIQMLA
jgi:hypothetical protein